MLTEKIKNVVTKIGEDYKSIKSKFDAAQLQNPHLKKAEGIFLTNMDGNLIENGSFYNGIHNFSSSFKLERRDTNNNFAAIEFGHHNGFLFHHSMIPIRHPNDVYLFKFDIKNITPEFRTTFHPFVESYLYSNWTLSAEYKTKVQFKLSRPFQKGDRQIYIHPNYIRSVNDAINIAKSGNYIIYIGEFPLIINGYSYPSDVGLQSKTIINGIRANSISWNSSTGVISNVAQSSYFKKTITTDEFLGISYYENEKPIRVPTLYTPINWTTVSARFRLSDYVHPLSRSFRVALRLNIFNTTYPQGKLKTLISGLRLYNLGIRGKVD